ncbi:ATP-binding cassette domain-containing protein [Rapidithrix thailandica]|uniref:ATP-binding cassette domain-containing protein n=1 Tax=Rapidithrix thailandica TaxID=413964 RepID=A0AAW9SCR5_9BACT
MSEEILKALTQLFAIISKQDGGVTNAERDFVIEYFRLELDTKTVEEYIALFDQFAEYGIATKEVSDKEKRKNKRKLTNVRDSVRTLAICKKINKTLNQQQKVIVLIKLLELVASDRSFTSQRMEIINTVSTVFNIPTEEYKLIESFVFEAHSSQIDHEDILIFDNDKPSEGSKLKYIDSGQLDGEIIFIRVKSVGAYFTKYTGKDEIYLNGQLVKHESVIQFAPGSVFKTPKGAPLYYSDLVSTYNTDQEVDNISFNVHDLEFKFPNGTIGFQNINLSESNGNLIGIMGASGAGKTTLLNVLAGLESPSKGNVLINGYNVHSQQDTDKIEGVIGYVSQDDLLIEELTVYQNLFYNAKLCFGDISDEEIDKRVMAVLTSLGLEKRAHLKVGSPLNKKISGGQRKRLNIALELIREPAIMFVDEPTSGLSSRDSENVIDLLKELSLRGKLIFVVIHQPSSDIFKMFDKMLIMDTGGFPIFMGNPIEAVTYFKSASRQVGSDRGQCATCGNVNPEQIFNIIESRVVDEYGEFTNKRKVQPEEWYKMYLDHFSLERLENVKEDPPSTLKIPSRIKQTLIFSVRDFLSKISNLQYLTINLLEAPFLALLISWVIRYRGSSDGEYIFRHNDNIPAYILICVVAALFMGMSVSAEEIIRDRKILKRETFLNLSRFSYLTSKVLILFAFSAIQTVSFVLIGNLVLGIDGLHFMYWLALFTASCHANVIGLNISSAFNSAVTVYILIPLLLIPQLIASGVIFDYDKLNNSISDKGKVPLVADFMASRWTYEGIAVEHFKSNKYEENLFEFEVLEKSNSFKSSYWKPKLDEIINQTSSLLSNKNDSTAPIIQSNILLLKRELRNDFYTKSQKVNIDSLVNEDRFSSEENTQALREYFNQVAQFYTLGFIRASESKDSVLYKMKDDLPEGIDQSQFKDKYYNDCLEEIVRNTTVEDRVVVSDGKVVQLMDPIFNIPSLNRSLLDYRVHFYAPVKPFLGKLFNTYTFNLMFIWAMTFILFMTLYFDVLSRIITWFGSITQNVGKKSK